MLSSSWCSNLGTPLAALVLDEVEGLRGLDVPFVVEDLGIVAPGGLRRDCWFWT